MLLGKVTDIISRDSNHKYGSIELSIILADTTVSVINSNRYTINISYGVAFKYDSTYSISFLYINYIFLILFNRLTFLLKELILKLNIKGHQLLHLEYL